MRDTVLDPCTRTRPGTLRGTSGSEPLRSRFAKCHSRGSARRPRPRETPPEAVAALEALLPRALDPIEERVEKTEQRCRPGVSRPVDATRDLHAQPEAGGEAPAGRGGRPCGQTSMSPGGVCSEGRPGWVRAYRGIRPWPHPASDRRRAAIEPRRQRPTAGLARQPSCSTPSALRVAAVSCLPRAGCAGRDGPVRTLRGGRSPRPAAAPARASGREAGARQKGHI